jgi:hypothetical protein
METVTLTHIQTTPENGLNRTLQELKKLETYSLHNQSFLNKLIPVFSNVCVDCLPGKIWRYVQNNFTYVSDEPFDEILTAPHIMISVKAGDCDDFALFIKTVLDYFGSDFWKTNFMLLGDEVGKWTHIVVFAHKGKIGREFIDPVYIDGVNKNFNVVPTHYRFYKIIE